MLNKVISYIKDVTAEMKKVTWPGKQELIGSTGVVLVLSVVVSLFLFVIDNLLAKAANLLF